MISTVTAQTCGLKITDPSASGSYNVTLTLGYVDGGTYYIIGSQNYTNLTPNAVNSLSLPWGLPIDTDDNIYILRAVAFNGTTPAYNNPAYSAWFNTDFYDNNNDINIIVYFY